MKHPDPDHWQDQPEPPPAALVIRLAAPLTDDDLIAAEAELLGTDRSVPTERVAEVER